MRACSPVVTFLLVVLRDESLVGLLPQYQVNIVAVVAQDQQAAYRADVLAQSDMVVSYLPSACGWAAR